MNQGDLQIETLFQVGPVAITSTVATTWVIMVLLWITSVAVTRRLRIDAGPVQVAIRARSGPSS